MAQCIQMNQLIKNVYIQIEECFNYRWIYDFFMEFIAIDNRIGWFYTTYNFKIYNRVKSTLLQFKFDGYTKYWIDLVISQKNG